METEKLELEMAIQDSPKSVKAELRRLHDKVQELEAMLSAVGAGGVSAQRVTQSPTLKASSDWLIDGGLLYRLNDSGTNCDEINVTMAGGLRTEAARVERAEAILNMLTIQKAADHIGKPSWDSHQWPQIVQDSSGNWFGVREGWTMRIAPSYKGDELWLLREDGEFLSHGECSQGWRTSLEQRPTTKPAPAELNLDGYYCKGCGRIGEIEELSAQDKAKLRKLDGKPKTAAAPVVLPEPDEYQYRMKPNWDAKLPWTPWEACSKESAASLRKRNGIHNWIFEVRERYTDQQVRELLAKDIDPVNLDRLGKALTKLGHATWVSQEEAAADIPRWVNALTSCVLEIPEAAPQPQADGRDADADADAELLDWLEGEVCDSYTGVTITRIDHREDGMVIERGFRLRRFHKDYEVKPTLRAAIAAAKGE